MKWLHSVESDIQTYISIICEGDIEIWGLKVKSWMFISKIYQSNLITEYSIEKLRKTPWNDGIDKFISRP